MEHNIHHRATNEVLTTLCVADTTTTKKIHLYDSNCIGADMTGANLSELFFDGSEFTGADLSASECFKTSFKRTDLHEITAGGADFSFADFTEADLSASDCTDANFENAKLINTNVSGVDFTEANLSFADCTGADFSFSNFRDTRLRNTNFVGAKLLSVSLQGADICFCIGNGKEICSMQIFNAHIVYCKETDTLAINHEQHTMKVWKEGNYLIEKLNLSVLQMERIFEIVKLIV